MPQHTRRYKLGSQLLGEENGQPMFAWYLCAMDGHGRTMDAVYLGTLAFGDPIVRLSREFVNNLNKLNE